jgi:hypothetical protein
MYYTDHMKPVKILACTLMAALVVIGFALFFLFPLDPFSGDTRFSIPNPGVFLFIIGAGIAVHLFNENYTYKPTPIPAGTPRKDTTTTAIMAYQSGMILRFALSEAIAIAAIAVAFILPSGGYLTYLFAAAVSLALMAYHVYPWDRPINKTQEALDAERGQSHLREIFGLDVWTGSDADKPVHTPAA